MSEKFKDVTIKGRKFRIKKFGAREGAFIVVKVSGLLAPMFAKLNFKQLQNVKKVEDVDLGKFDIGGAIAEMSQISEADFNYLQEKSLRVCSELLESNPNPIPVLNDNGSFGVVGLEEDAMAVMSLTVHALMFNLSGFFEGSGLGGLLNGLSTTTP